MLDKFSFSALIAGGSLKKETRLGRKVFGCIKMKTFWRTGLLVVPDALRSNIREQRAFDFNY
jgi:hypothetical protein